MKEKSAVRFIREMLGIYLGKRVSRSAAELAYFLTMSVFPMLICLHAMLGSLFPESQSLLLSVGGLIPENAREIISDYVEYVSTHSSNTMLATGLAAMATTSAAAFRCLHNIMADIQGLPRFRGVRFLISSFFFSLVFLAVIYFAVIVLISGGWLINFLDSYLTFLHISSAWEWLRFVMLFAALLMIVYGIYRITAPKGTAMIMPGALAATVSLVAVSMLFSWFIGMSVKYSLIYGSLASIIIMMFWFYVCGIVVIMGNALNIVIRRMRK